MGCHFFLQGVFPTLCLPHCRHNLYHWATREVLCPYNSWETRILDSKRPAGTHLTSNVLLITKCVTWNFCGSPVVKNLPFNAGNLSLTPGPRKISHAAEQLSLRATIFSQLFVRPPQMTTLPSYISFSWGWFWSPPSIQCHEPLSIVLQALCLPDLIPWIYVSHEWSWGVLYAVLIASIQPPQ